MPLNADWHRANPMPKKPTEAERIAWHVAHARACACRPIPAPLRARMQALGIAAPEPAGDADGRARER